MLISGFKWDVNERSHGGVSRCDVMQVLPRSHQIAPAGGG
jgi:hypothetical protein